MGRDLHHFPLQFEASNALVETMARGDRRAVLRFLRKEGECRWTINALADAAGVTYGLAKRTITDLEALQLVRVERTQYRYRVHVTSDLARMVRECPGLAEDFRRNGRVEAGQPPTYTKKPVASSSKAAA